MKPNNLKKHQDNGSSPPPPRQPNWQNRTLFHKDNLEVMRGMNSETVDLIATDPPFKKDKDFHITPDKLEGKQVQFQDRWSWEDDVHETWSDQIKNDYPKLMEAIESARCAHSDGMGAFMCYMSVRLLEMHRILKPTGSIYLHCDPTASHYLKACMDAIFGWKNFNNEIIWGYKTGGTPREKGGRYARKHDIILFYSKKQGNQTFNDIKEVSYIRTLPEPHTKSGKRLGVLRDKIGKYRYVRMRDWWVEYGLNKEIDMTPLYRNNKERTRYPTQKPLKLYERIINISTNPGDIVLDPFCGCATTCVAAERTGRQWVGIDIWAGANQLVLDRVKREGLAKKGEENYMLFTDESFQYRKDIPVRDDDGEVASTGQSAIWVRPKEPWQKLTTSQMKPRLTEWQTDATSGNVVCAGCGRILEKEFMEIDHIRPRSDGGSNFIDNRILLCRPCNGKKSNKLTMAGLIQQNKKDGWMQDHVKATWAKNQVKHGVSALQRDMYDPFLK